MDELQKYLQELELQFTYAAHMALPIFKAQEPHDIERDARVAIVALLASQ